MNLPIMSIKIEFDDVGRSVVRRVVIVVDVALPPPTPFVDLVSLVEGAAAESRRFPMANVWVYK